jgi:Domain of unknown function (DUF4136)
MIKALLISLFAITISGCASTVVTDYDSGTIFGNYDTWSFAPARQDSDEYVSLDDTRIRNAIEEEMKGESLRMAAADEADLLVDWRIVTEERIERGGSGFGFGLGFGSGSHFGWGISAPPPIEKVEEGKLVIQFVDAQSKQVVWRAASRRYLDEDMSSENRQELIEEIVNAMFAKYPPGA